jgi:hypothetical protein
LSLLSAAHGKPGGYARFGLAGMAPPPENDGLKIAERWWFA